MELRDSITSKEEVDTPIIWAKRVCLLEVLFGCLDIPNLLVHQCACEVGFSTVWLKLFRSGYICLTCFLPAEERLKKCNTQNG